MFLCMEICNVDILFSTHRLAQEALKAALKGFAQKSLPWNAALQPSHT
jgi:hypothetical protein